MLGVFQRKKFHNAAQGPIGLAALCSHHPVCVCRVPTWRTLRRARQIALERPSVPGRRQTGSPGGEAAPPQALSSPLDGALHT